MTPIILNSDRPAFADFPHSNAQTETFRVSASESHTAPWMQEQILKDFYGDDLATAIIARGYQLRAKVFYFLMLKIEILRVLDSEARTRWLSDKAPEAMAANYQSMLSQRHRKPNSLAHRIFNDGVPPFVFPACSQCDPEELTARESDVLRLLADEYASSEIAAQLKISQRTVDTYRQRLKDKVGCKNLSGLVQFAIRHRIVSNAEH